MSEPVTSTAILSSTDQCLGLLDMRLPEEELAVQVREIDRIEVDDVDLAEACRDQVLE